MSPGVSAELLCANINTLRKGWNRAIVGGCLHTPPTLSTPAWAQCERGADSPAGALPSGCPAPAAENTVEVRGAKLARLSSDRSGIIQPLLRVVDIARVGVSMTFVGLLVCVVLTEGSGRASAVLSNWLRLLTAGVVSHHQRHSVHSTHLST